MKKTKKVAREPSEGTDVAFVEEEIVEGTPEEIAEYERLSSKNDVPANDVPAARGKKLLTEEWPRSNPIVSWDSDGRKKILG